MRIFYAVQATGNGHVSRAEILYPYLCQFGEVDIMLSGNNASLIPSFPVAYRSQGWSLQYARKGGINYWKTATAISPLSAYKQAVSLPLDSYDIILNDFDFLTAYACRLQGVHSVQFGHQASFHSPVTPRPTKRSWIGESILRHYAPATHYVGLHFQRYDSYIFPPIIKPHILQASPTNNGHICVYLPAYHIHDLTPFLTALFPFEVHCFHPAISQVARVKNITFYPVSNHQFNASLIAAHAVLTSAGFETPAEALFLQKKVVCIPIKGQYEQACNAAAFAKMGGKVITHLNVQTASELRDYFGTNTPVIPITPNDIPTTLSYVFDSFNRR